MSDVTAYLTGVIDENEIETILQIRRFCKDNLVSYPAEVEDFLGDLLEESDACVREEIGEMYLVAIGGYGVVDFAASIPVKEMREENGDCRLEFLVKDIPENIKKLRLKLSY